MKHQDSLEQLYKYALSSSYKPDTDLNNTLISKMEEHAHMRKKTKFILSPVMAVIVISVMALSALAAWFLLSPSDVAGMLGDPVLAEAFRGENAVIVNETRSQNGYDVSFLGIVSGKGLTAFDGGVDADKTYAVVAIARQDGVMPGISDNDFDGTPFFVSPLIHGQTPWHYNIASMGGGYSTCVADGVMYRLIECDSVEMFADRGLSLIVSSTAFYSIEAYDYDETTGLVTPNPEFDGINLLFDLPIDAAKGDYAKAQAYLDALWDTDDDGGYDTGGQPDIDPDSQLIQNADNASGAGVQQVMSYDEYKAWMEDKLAQTQKLVDSGEYSEASLALDRADYERNLAEIAGGAQLTMVTYPDGGYSVHITYPDTGFLTEIDASGNTVIKDNK